MALIRLSLFPSARTLQIRICSPALAVPFPAQLWLLPWALGCARGWENPQLGAESSQGNTRSWGTAEPRIEAILIFPSTALQDFRLHVMSLVTDNIILANSAVPGKSPQILLLSLIFATQNTRLTGQHPFCDGFVSLVLQTHKKGFLKGRF